MRNANAIRELARAPEPTIHFRDDDLVSASLGNVIFTVMWRSMTLESLKRVQVENEKLLRMYPRGTATFNVVFPSSLMPEPAARDAAAQALAEHGHRHLCSATVILGEGFWASAIRSALTTMFLMSRQRVPSKVFSSLDDAAIWVADKAAPEGPYSMDIAFAAQSLHAMGSVTR